MDTYEFSDKVTGEDFLVEAISEDEAIKIAKQYFEEPICYGTISFEEAEMLGWDTY